MSNAFDKASLVMLPHAYEEGKVYSLKPTDRSGDFTFSRGTDTATRVGPTGLIEKGRKNLLLQSNQFDSVSWSGLSKTSGILGYDGTNDAWEITKPAQPYTAISQSVSATGVWTFSLYAKANTLDKISIRNQTDGEKADIDLLNGLITYTSSGIVHSDIELISNDWYRLQITFSGSTAQIAIYVAWNNPTAGSVYIQDAQLNQGLVAYPYLETTTAPVYGGLTDDMPRLDYSGGATCPSLLLEPSRTNLIDSSEYFGAGWASNDTTITSNTSTSPEGLQNATTLADTSTSSFQEIQYRPSFTAGASYTFSMFIKKDSDTTRFPEVFFRIYNGGTEQAVAVQINTQTGEKVDRYKTGTSPESSVVDFSDDYWRLIINTTDPNDGNSQLRIYLRPAMSTTIGSTSASATGSIVAYGLQLEQGSYPTSYIPTYGSSQTRAAESFSATGLADYLGDSEGTLYIEAEQFQNTGFVSIIETSNSGVTLGVTGGNNFLLNVRVAGTNQADIQSGAIFSANTNFKLAGKYKTNDFEFFKDGISIGTDTSGNTFGDGDLITIQSDSSFPASQPFYGRIKQILVFPTALSDSECIALTTV